MKHYPAADLWRLFRDCGPLGIWEGRGVHRCTLRTVVVEDGQPLVVELKGQGVGGVPFVKLWNGKKSRTFWATGPLNAEPGVPTPRPD